MYSKPIKISIDKQEAEKLCYQLSENGYSFPEDWENPNIEGNGIQWHISHLKSGDFLYSFNGIDFYIK